MYGEECEKLKIKSSGIGSRNPEDKDIDPETRVIVPIGDLNPLSEKAREATYARLGDVGYNDLVLAQNKHYKNPTFEKKRAVLYKGGYCDLITADYETLEKEGKKQWNEFIVK